MILGEREAGSTPLLKGRAIKARWRNPEDGTYGKKWYNGVIRKMNSDGDYEIEYQDGSVSIADVEHIRLEEPLEKCSPAKMAEWPEYTDPITNRRWFFNEATEEYFFEDEASDHGWAQYSDAAGKPWWWHEASQRSFRPRFDKPLVVAASNVAHGDREAVLTNIARDAEEASDDLVVGDRVMRKGQEAIVVKIDRTLEPPSFSVRMLADGREVGTERAYLEKLPPRAESKAAGGFRASSKGDAEAPACGASAAGGKAAVASSSGADDESQEDEHPLVHARADDGSSSGANGTAALREQLTLAREQLNLEKKKVQDLERKQAADRAEQQRKAEGAAAARALKAAAKAAAKAHQRHPSRFASRVNLARAFGDVPDEGLPIVLEDDPEPAPKWSVVKEDRGEWQSKEEEHEEWQSTVREVERRIGTHARMKPLWKEFVFLKSLDTSRGEILENVADWNTSVLKDFLAQADQQEERRDASRHDAGPNASSSGSADRGTGGEWQQVWEERWEKEGSRNWEKEEGRSWAKEEDESWENKGSRSWEREECKSWYKALEGQEEAEQADEAASAEDSLHEGWSGFTDHACHGQGEEWWSSGASSSSSARPCPNGCGFQVTWHETHCCARCAQGWKGHGRKCEQIPMPGIRQQGRHSGSS